MSSLRAAARPTTRAAPEGPERLRRDFEPFLRWAGVNFIRRAMQFLSTLANKLSEEEVNREIYSLLDDAYEEVKRRVLPRRGPTYLGLLVGQNKTLVNVVTKMAADTFARYACCSNTDSSIRFHFPCYLEQVGGVPQLG